MKILLSDIAEKSLSKLNKLDQQITIKKLEFLRVNYDSLKNSKNIKRLVNSDKFRYKISNKLRALFEICESYITIHILEIGQRENFYEKFKKR